MEQPSLFVTSFAPVVLALLFVLAYFIIAKLWLSASEPPVVIVPRYDPPVGASPAVAAWLLSPGDLPRSIASAIVSMASKGFLRIEQNGDLYSIIRLETAPSISQEPEEDVLARKLLDDEESFDFVEVTPELKSAVQTFRWALHNTEYFSDHIAISVPAWIVSAAAVFWMLLHARLSRGSMRLLEYDLLGTFVCFIITLRTAGGPLEKIATLSPSSTAPRRPWTGADTLPLTFLAACFVGIAVLALATDALTAVLIAAFMLVNGVFLHALQGTTTSGIKMAAQLKEYRQFLSTVEADPISRTDPADQVPATFTQKGAYALAFRLDRGWGEQFVMAIADLIEIADIVKQFKLERDSSN